MRIGSNKCVRVGARTPIPVLDEYGLRDVFEIHLVADSNIGRHHTTILKCLLSPFEKDVSFTVAFQLTVGVEGERSRTTVLIDLYGMIDDQVDLLEGINPFRVAAHLLDDISHRGKIYNRRNAREVLHQDACRTKCNFFFQAPRSERGHQRANVIGRNRLSVFKAKQIFQHYLQRKREFRYLTGTRLLRVLQREVLEFNTSYFQRRLRIERVHKKILTGSGSV